MSVSCTLSLALSPAAGPIMRVTHAGRYTTLRGMDRGADDTAAAAAAVDVLLLLLLAASLLLLLGARTGAAPVGM